MGAAEYVTGAEAPEIDDRHDRLRLVADRAAPRSLAREHTLPVLDAVAPLFPDGALRRGTVVGFDGGGVGRRGRCGAGGAPSAGSGR